tara:strand:- start:1094 stop:2296 length:1203 start_codon:yes stop_codon:yes gene_type:complete
LTVRFLKTWSEQNTDNLDDLIEVIDRHSFKTKRFETLFDFSSISFQCSFGLKNPKIEKHIKSQLETISISTPKFQTESQKYLADRLVEKIRMNGKIFFTTSGAESVSNAIKILRQSTGKKLIYSFKKSYHGATNEALEVTGDWRRENNHLSKNNHRWLVDPSEDCDFSKSSKLLKSNQENLCGIIIEPVSGKNGVYTPPLSWWKGLKKAKEEIGFKLISDEVVCGFYRTGKFFGFQNFKIKPDVICMAKAITGGFVPFGAVFFRKNIVNSFSNKVLSAGLTNYAHPLGVAASHAVLDIIETVKFKNTLKKNIEIFNHFQKTLSEYFTVRSKGLLLAIDLEKEVEIDTFQHNGLNLIINNKTIIIAPSLTCSSKLLKKNLLILEKIIRQQSRNGYVFKKVS